MFFEQVGGVLEHRTAWVGSADFNDGGGRNRRLFVAEAIANSGEVVVVE